MKKSWLRSAIFFALLTSGCGLVETPNELMRAPSSDSDQKSINQAIMQYLPAGSQLTVPLNPDESSAVSLRDLDADGIPEAVAFYKTEKNDYEIGVLILTQNKGHWEKLTSFSNIGNRLDFVQFVDLTGDNQPEILIGLGGGDDLNKELSIYSLVQGRLQEQIKLPYSVLAVGDLDQDGKAELAVILHDHDKLVSTLHLYGAADQKMTKLAEQTLDGYVNGYDQALIGKASHDKNGLFIEAGLGAHSASTDLWIWEDGKLRNPLAKINNEMELTFKPYPLLSEDINQDGLIEIGIHTQPPGTEDLPMSSIPWIASYFQWDGKDGLAHVEDHYQNYDYGLDFRIPDKWAGKFTVATEPQNEPQMTTFYYYQEATGEKLPLLTLQAVPQQEWSKAAEKWEQQQRSYVILKEGGKTVHVAIQPEMPSKMSASTREAYSSMLLSTEEIRQFYRPLQMPL